jgi:hypothetical protein
MKKVELTEQVAGALADDLVWGCKAIAIEIGRTERQIFWLLESGALPAKKIGGRWCARRSALCHFFSGNAA